MFASSPQRVLLLSLLLTSAAAAQRASAVEHQTFEVELTTAEQSEDGAARAGVALPVKLRGPQVVVFAHARHDTADLQLRAVDSEGASLDEVAEPTPGRIAWLKFTLAIETEVEIELRAPGLQGASTCELEVSFVHETEATLAAAAHAAVGVERFHDAHEAQDFEATRQVIAGVLQELLARTDLRDSAAIADALFEVAQCARMAGLSQEETPAREHVLAFREKVMPAEHPTVVKARQGLAANLLRLGRTREACDLFEQVLAARLHLLDPAHPDVLGAKSNYARALLELGNIQSARKLQEEILTILERTLEEDDEALQDARLQLAGILESFGDFRGSMNLLEKVLKVQEGTLPEDDARLRRTRGSYGMLLYRLGDPAGAGKCFEQVLASAERSRPKEHPEVTTARATLAAALGAMGELSRALELQELNLEIYERTNPPHSQALLRSRMRYAQTLKGLGDLQRARRIEAGVVETCEQNFPGDDLFLLKVRQNHSATLTQLGDIEGARRLQEAVLSTMERTLPEDHADLQFVRVEYSKTLDNLGDLAGAKILLERTIAALDGSVEEHQSILQHARYRYAATLAALGDLQGARASFEQNLETLESALPADHRDVLSARSGLANMLAESGELNRARELHEQVLDAKERTLPEHDLSLQTSRLNYVGVLIDLGSFEEARNVLDPVLAALQQSMPEDNALLLAARGSHASILTKTGEHGPAAQVFRSILEIQERMLPAGHPQLVQARRNLAVVLMRLGTLDGELAAVLEGLASDLLRQQTSYRTHLSFRQATTLAEESNAGIDTLLAYSPYTDEADRGGLEERAFAAIETARCAESAVRRLARLAPSSGSEQALRADELRLTAARANDRIAQLVAAGDGRDALRAAIDEKERVELDLVRLLSQQAGAGALLEPTTVGGLARLLEPGEAAVGFWSVHASEWTLAPRQGGVREPGEVQRTYVAFVVRDDGSLTRVDLGSADRLDLRVKAWRTMVKKRGGQSAEALAKQATALRAALLDPVLAAAGDVSRLYVALDGALHLVALDSLPMGDDAGRLVGDSIEIHPVTALRDLFLVEDDPELAPSSLLAAGAIDYQATAAGDPGGAALAYQRDVAPREALRSSSFDPLPASLDEVKAVAALYGDTFAGARPAALLTGGAATRGAFLRQASKARFIHLATHAWFAPEEIPSSGDRAAGDVWTTGTRESLGETIRGYAPMLLCGVAFAGAASDEEDTSRLGILTAQEISALDFSGCELAVLSACETSLGSRRPGQGVASLQQALHAAGVRLSLTSLWKVPDTATQKLMDEFYRRLWQEGEPPHRALWEAKRMLREATDPQGKHLHSAGDWAGWVLSGAGR